MKKFIYLSVLLIFILPSLKAQDIKEKKIGTTISSAVIYLTGAEIIRSKKININSGKTRLIFKDLSSKLDSKSIRITTNNNVDILGISSKINYLSKKEDMPNIKKLKDSLKLITRQIQDISDEADAYIVEKQMLLKNTSIGGQDKGVSISELKQASDFYRNKIIEINSKISKLNRKKSELNLSTQRIQNQLNELNANTNYSRSEISILVSSDVAVSTNIELKYIVNDAGWSPSYDIKAIDTDKPVKLEYRAKVYNNTGIDWNNLKIKLSTADPNLSVSKPILKPWYLRYQTYSYEKQIFQGEGYMQNRIVSETNMPRASRDEFGGLGEGNESVIISGEFSETAVPELSAEFNIKKTYSIPSDDKPYLVDISEHDLPATYRHFAVTKLDKDVFLLARISGWQDLNLIEGPANVYYSGTYLGQSFIYTRNVSDTLDLSLGRDGKVLVTRTKMKKFSSTQFVGNKRKETMTYQLIAKNNRKSDITIQILDQLPISQTDEIEVKVLEISGAEQNETTGELKWELNLKPGESKKILLSFEIKYPKNKQIEIIQKKSKQVRYF
ncbi:MAG: DUF4139 domain-containing protein [Bacteroidales bacterium]|nr:DUF4139 domain-containing protein [Bacteroidales bacterium]